jgi:predicted ABC-type transport system involved in lysophospholipase L1 biosynthesis ATPase subunit
MGEVKSIGRVFITFLDEETSQNKRCKRRFARILEEAHSVQLVSSDEEGEDEELASRHVQSLIMALATAARLTHDPNSRSWEEQKRVVTANLMSTMDNMRVPEQH